MAIRFDKLTIKAQEALQRAQTLAADRGNPQIEPLHLLASLVAESDGVIRPILEKIGVNRGQLDRIIDAELGHLPKVSGGAQPQLSDSLVKVIEAAQKQAETMKDEFVSTEHLLLSLAQTDPKVKNVLKLNAIDEKSILTAMQAVRGSTRVTDQNPEGKYEALERYGRDLTELARNGKLAMFESFGFRDKDAHQTLGVCLPEGTHTKTVVENFLAFARQHDDDRKYNPSFLIYWSLLEKYPCKS